MRSILILSLVLTAAGFRLLAASPETNSWQALQKAEQEFLDTSPPDHASVKQLDRFLHERAHRAVSLADRMEAFYRADPHGPRAEDAWTQWMQLLMQGAMFDTNTAARLQRIEENFLRDPKLSLKRRIDIRQNQIERTRDPKKRERLILAARDEIRRARQTAPPFTNTIVPVFMWEEDLLLTAENSDPETARRLLHEVRQEGKNYDRNEANQLEAQLDRIGHRLDLRFRSLSGKTIDLTNYLGKVVLVDFWATWCPPCVLGLPKVKAAWEEFHARGFDVIGFSYDTERSALERFVAQNKLGWPEYFDKEGRDSLLAGKLGKPGPPAYWLIDRAGKLVDLNADSDLELKVERLLKGEPVYPH